ncbi:uncharacterized protein LOC124629845 isoform X11 [Helicoverpa zea]|uniref:uncharacterized protein LOC124629845 isoform X11 n=1 Tax=Helicoverpa zea TaxID=7113 RepID=UPI001F583D71|nr:uncharacterized protein LOC124629845 isoform X11 [Helicoverpa zea]
MSDIKSLIKKRASIKAKLTQFSSYLNISKSCEQLSEVQIVEVEYRLNTIENLYDKYDVLQADMEEMVDDPSEQYAEREEFEKQYYSLVAAARQLISNARKQASGNSIAEDGSLRCFLVETALHESPTSAHVRVSFGERSTLFARYPSPLLLKTLQRGEYVESSHSLQPRPRQVGATVTSWCNGSPRMRRVQRSNLAYAHRPRPRVLTTLILICLIVLYCYI